ncbi:MAG: Signal peptide peptidase SppA, 36K type [Candidatus Nomurabacteria bacterium GW2011_GWA2_42_41]|nr:MAG: Signal peptide peptidase SppA, 36K type [Candidatus Nomurabacteria bacterium GW2011_GWA2_42_41]
MKTLQQEIRTIALWSAAGTLVFASGLWVFGNWHDEWSGYNAINAVSDGSCNIAVIPIVGDIIPYRGANEDGSGATPPPSTNPDDVLAALRMAENDPNIHGVLVPIDSAGGVPVASEIIANEIKGLSLPTVALIRETGASGAYLVATGADTIIASVFSDVGSIGITMSYLDNTAKNTKDGLRYVPLASAQFKDYGNPDKSLTQAERALIERDLKIFHEQFVKEVAENRNLPIEQVAKLADGSSMAGTLALQNKLIDALGDQEAARMWFAENLGIPTEEVVFCE